MKEPTHIKQTKNQRKTQRQQRIEEIKQNNKNVRV